MSYVDKHQADHSKGYHLLEKASQSHTTCCVTLRWLLGISSVRYAMEKPNVVLMVVAKWLHEYDSENQISGDHDFILCKMSLLSPKDIDD